MTIIHIVAGCVLGAVLLYWIYVMYESYRSLSAADKAHWTDHLWALGSGSATKVWMRIVGIVGAGLGLVYQFAGAANLPQVQDVMKQYISAQNMTIALAVIAVIGVLARSRTSDIKSYF